MFVAAGFFHRRPYFSEGNSDNALGSTRFPPAHAGTAKSAVNAQFRGCRSSPVGRHPPRWSPPTFSNVTVTCLAVKRGGVAVDLQHGIVAAESYPVAICQQEVAPPKICWSRVRHHHPFGDMTNRSGPEPVSRIGHINHVSLMRLKPTLDQPGLHHLQPAALWPGGRREEGWLSIAVTRFGG